ncbi:MAG: type I methionyl aminopeptidase [bacterium]|nr:type I methionyl aminopeptidase [bacterium]
MQYIKTKQELQKMKKSGEILREVIEILIPTIAVGMTTNEIDAKAEALILKRGGSASFKTVSGYLWTTCLPINEQAVHTPPTDRILKDGDILTVDIGVVYQGYHTDYATTIALGTVPQSTKDFLQKGEQTLEKALKMFKSGERVGTISQFIETQITGGGYCILKELTGHGIGKALHEKPYILNYLERPIEKTLLLQSGMTLAVEIIYAQSTEHIAYERELEWSIISADRSLSACFEKSIAIDGEKPYILT